jgi:transcriptional regulator with GAF, ATPase, and Fis domain
MRDQTPQAAEARLNRLLISILETSVTVLGFDAVTVTTRHDGSLSTIATTDQRLIALDDAQYEAREGPYLAVLDPNNPVVVRSMDVEHRWPNFVETARHCGVNASVSVHVPLEEIEDLAASMNFYARRPMEITKNVVNSAGGYAMQVADAMAAVESYRATATLARHLAEAMKSRAAIEQAKGILIAEKQVDPDEAFALLVRMSQHANIKVRDVARRVVDDRSSRITP